MTVTPEAVLVESDHAGLGSRLFAALLDLMIQALATMLVIVTTLAAGPDVRVVVGTVAGFLLFWGYPIAFEIAWSGQTPGKRAARIRVVTTEGQPPRAGAIVVRNLLRIVDLVPSTYAVGTISILVTRRAQRLGDLAAGTMVVHEARATLPSELHLPDDPLRDRVARGIDTGRVGPQEYAAIRAFLKRRSELPAAVRAQIARDLRDRLVSIVGLPPPEADPETYLEAIVESRRRGTAGS